MLTMLSWLKLEMAECEKQWEYLSLEEKALVIIFATDWKIFF
jgi:hypothetical protein